ncbi:gamma-aminobutyric acid type B receptor subunit 2-like [Acropora palmata]|uniref:gamma-aminobutyric acid type B receptor subunit 2-like n=1 Tax=Acropora palmata TaxID=6131 RepID=UPI003D9FB6E1
MISAVSFPVLFVLTFGLLKCHGNKTVLVFGTLDTLSKSKLTKMGFNLALNVSKNNSKFKSFFEKYDIELFSLTTFADPDKAVVFSDLTLMQWKNCFLILGPHTAVEATSVLHVVGFYRKLMVTFLTSTATRSELSEPYGFTFKRIPTSFNGAKIKLVEHFNWKRVAVLYDFSTDAALYVKVVNDFAERKKNFNVVYEAINSQLQTSDNKLQNTVRGHLNKLKDQDFKIFLGVFGEVAASLVFCELYRMGMYGPEYVWILNPEAGTVDRWAELNRVEALKNKSVCTKGELEVVANRTFLLAGNDLRSDNDTKTDSGLSLVEFFKLLKGNLTDEEKSIIALSFDVMWAILTALNETSQRYSLQPNTELTGSLQLTSYFNKQLQNVSLEGFTGPMSFDERKVIKGITLVKQYQDAEKKLVTVGEVTGSVKGESIIKFFNGSEKTLWKDNRIPSDHTRKTTDVSDIPAYLFIVFSAIASLGIVLGVIFLVFNRYYRKCRFIRLSAPLFNDVMVLGCIACLATVFLFGLRKFQDPKNSLPLICKSRTWILNIGFSLAFGAMFIKTWRIYKICTNKRLKVRLGPLSDLSMLAMVGAIILVDVAILLSWELADPLKHQAVIIDEMKDSQDPFKINEIILDVCTSEKLALWLTLIYVYKGIMLLYGLFLAYETRNVVYPHLNDSRVIGICVYNVVVLSMIGAFLSVILDDKQFKELYASLSLCIIFPASATISLIFIPKLVHRIKLPSLEDDTGDTTMHSVTMAPPSVDFPSTLTAEPGKEKFVDGSYTNELCVAPNGVSMRSNSLTPPSPAPPHLDGKDTSAKPLED